MKLSVFHVLALSGIFISVFAQQQDSTVSEAEKEAMEIGGIVTLDYAGPLDALENSGFSIGSVGLDANVNVNERTVGSISLLAEEDMSEISIDQAVAEYSMEKIPATVYLGLHYFNHGLLPSHLISSPLIVDNVEFSAPGLTVTYEVKSLLIGGGLTITPVEMHRSLYKGVINIDYNLPNESVIRLSSLITNKSGDIDAAASIALGIFSLDAEFFSELVTQNDAEKCGGYLAGIACNVNDRVSVAFRNDGLTLNSFSGMDFRLGLGATLNITDEIFIALEFSRNQPEEGDPSNEIAIQAGLESKLKLPGFQRRTLARN